MSAPKSRRAISRAMPSSICVSRAPLKSSTIANRLSGNTRSPARLASSAGPPNGSPSLMKTWACLAAELRRGLPVGFVWGEEEGEVCFHPDEAVCTAIRQIFAQFAETGSARRVWLWFRSEGLKFPLQMHQGGEIRWVEASYTAIHQVLTNPVYAGAYVYGRT